jgi:hypothetical protein
VAWFKAYGWGEGALGRGAIIHNRSSNLNVYGNGGKYLFSRTGVEAGRDVLTPNFLNKWYMVVVTSPSSGAGTQIYTNGEKAWTTSFDAGTPVAGLTNITIGNASDQSRTFDGLISGVRIIDGLLTAAEISQLYTNERQRYV